MTQMSSEFVLDKTNCKNKIANICLYIHNYIHTYIHTCIHIVLKVNGLIVQTFSIEKDS